LVGFSDEEDDFADELSDSLLFEELLPLETELADVPDDECFEELPEVLCDFETEASENDSFLLP
jgi:hypothetical protein